MQPLQRRHDASVTPESPSLERLRQHAGATRVHDAAKFYNFDLEKLKPHAARAAVMPKDVAEPLDGIPDGVTRPNLRRALYEKKGQEAPPSAH